MIIGRVLLWFVTKRALALEVERLKGELRLAELKVAEAETRVELAKETLTEQREWVHAIGAVARFEYARHESAANAMNAGGPK